MNGRFAAALALMLAGTALTGCIEAMSFLSSSDTEVTAGENRDLADAAAAAWRPDAQLVAVFAMENPNMTDDFPSDPDVGNGRAPLWIYGYVGDNRSSHRAFQVSADGQVRTLNASIGDAPSDYGDAIDAWNVDSAEAVEIARANATFDGVASGPEVVFMEALGREEGMTVWAIMAGSASGQAMAVINAMDGTLIMAEAFTLDFDVPAMPGWSGPVFDEPQVEIEDSGTLTADERFAEYEFSVSHADVATLEVEADGTSPTDQLHWMIFDANDEVIEEGRTSDEETFEFSIDEAGDYRLVLHYITRAPLWFVPPMGELDYDMRFVVGPDFNVDVDCC